MISKIYECKSCFSKEVCSISALALEENVERKAPVGEFKAF